MTGSFSSRVDRETVRAYLTEMYLGAPGLLQVWAFPRKGSGEFFETTEDGIEQAIDSIEIAGNLEGQQSIYSRVTTMKQKPADKYSRGKVSDSESFIGLWTDIDFGLIGHDAGEKLPADATEAQKVYDATGLPTASITVNSGGGLYHLVLLDVPVDITDTELRLRIGRLARRWQYRVKDASEKLGYKYGTQVSDLARVLRIPGTINAKDWENRRPATFTSNGLRYTLQELEEACPEPPKPKAREIPVDAEPAADATGRMDQLLTELRACTFERNNALNEKAFMAFQYAGAGQLNPDAVEQKFTTVALEIGLDEREVQATVRSARDAGLQRPFTWRTWRPRTEQTDEQQEEMWAGQLDESGQVTSAATAPAATAVATPVREKTSETPVSETENETETEPDPLLDLNDPLIDTRLPDIAGTFRASSDKKPFTVATEVRDKFFLHNGKPTLMRWQDMWVRWNGSCWSVMSDADVTSWLYQRMDRAYMVAKVDEQWVESPWNPGNSNINNLDKALRAAVNLRDDAQQNTMVGEGIHDLAISCTNGLLRVTGRELAPADPAFFTFSSVPFAYSRDAVCPQWIEWLEDTFEHDPDSVAMIQEWFGYVISGRTDLQKALMLQGVERSGKGTIARILQKLAGERNSCGPTLNSLTEQFGLWALTDKTLAVIGDARLPKKGTEVITERLLSIIGEDGIQVDRKWQRPWQGKIPARIVLLTNEIPNWSDSAGVLPTRWIVATTTKSYLGKEDPTLLDRLSAELPGILNWALDGLDRLLKQGKFTVNTATPEIVGAQRDRSAPQKGFVAEVCVLGESTWVSKERLREMWTLWNREHGRLVTDTRESFTTKLLGMVPAIRARDQKKRIDGRLTPIYRGIGLRIDYPELIEKEEEEKEPENTGPVQETLPDTEPTATTAETVPAPRNGVAVPQHDRGTEVRSNVNRILRTINRPINITYHKTEENRQ